ncbi:hypothetical protein CRE_03062 [Caenorhabditis remanei]|uniref:Uncharacterized protein n=1 Tax=Caenorhabditis remanei TaxID=31234 RepID=E3LWC9_CAERE|nr:hypothetical protein CRE_03062 [Caenorhabditis remanei]
MSSTMKKYNKAKWQDFSFQETRIIERGQRELHEWRAIFPNGREIRFNVSYFEKEYLKLEKLNVFIMDEDDLSFIQSTKKNELAPVHMMSLEPFTIGRKKHFYIRAINTGNPNEVGGMTYSRKVFTDEILQIIPLLMKQQNTPLADSDRRLEDYKNKWKSGGEHLFTAIELNEFEEVLKDFDIDKSQITIVPDITHYWSSIEIIEQNQAFATTITPNGMAVMEPSHAAYMHFLSVVCGVNWNSDAVKGKIIYFQQVMNRIIDEYREMKGTFVSLSSVFDSILTASSSCFMIPPVARMDNVDYTFSKFLTYSSPVPLDTYHFICRSSGLPIYQDFTLQPNHKSVSIPAWMARFFVQAGWINKNVFFSGGVSIPDSEIDWFIGKMKKVLETNKLLESAKKREELLRQRKLDKKNKTDSELSGSDVKTVNPEAAGQNEPVRTEREIEPEKKKPMQSELTQTSPVECDNCFKSNRVRDEVKKELEATKNKLKHSEERSKQTDKLDKVLCENKKKIKTLESEAKKMKSLEKKASRVDELEKILEERQKEIEELKLQNTRLTEENFDIRRMEGNAYEDMKLMEMDLKNLKAEKKNLLESNKLITKSRDHLTEKVKQLEAQINSDKEVAQSQQETTERDRIIQELEATSMRVSIQNQEQTKEIQSLLEKLRMSKQ